MHSSPSKSSRRGFSLPEIITVVGLIGILAAVAIPTFAGYLDHSRAATARDLVETLNGAVHRFNEVNYELVLTGSASNAGNELAILRTLQYRKASYPAAGSPYMMNAWNPVASSSTQDYRIVWAGNLFTLVSPGASGTGLKVNFNGSDVGRPYTYPAGYTMVGQ